MEPITVTLPQDAGQGESFLHGLFNNPVNRNWFIDELDKQAGGVSGQANKILGDTKTVLTALGVNLLLGVLFIVLVAVGLTGLSAGDIAGAVVPTKKGQGDIE